LQIENHLATKVFATINPIIALKCMLLFVISLPEMSCIISSDTLTFLFVVTEAVFVRVDVKLE